MGSINSGRSLNGAQARLFSPWVPNVRLSPENMIPNRRSAKKSALAVSEKITRGIEKFRAPGRRLQEKSPCPGTLTEFARSRGQPSRGGVDSECTNHNPREVQRPAQGPRTSRHPSRSRPASVGSHSVAGRRSRRRLRPGGRPQHPDNAVCRVEFLWADLPTLAARVATRTYEAELWFPGAGLGPLPNEIRADEGRLTCLWRTVMRARLWAQFFSLPWVPRPGRHRYLVTPRPRPV